MNFLAHFHLAWPEEGLVVGALEGDFRKGWLRGELPGNIERGVALHRAIDAYTDSHPLMAELRREFPQAMRRYAGILIDLSFDHYLSLHWDKFSDLPLANFIPIVYHQLEQNSHHLSGSAEHMRKRMLQHDILGRYNDWETVPASATRIGERFRRGNPFEDVRADIDPVRNKLEQAFLEFYPELQSWAATTRQRLN
ncbi:ACP phosphodiesterase [Pseudohalioglobus lutimaris]|uniref:ACP phosphodiesterase n=1 Tax=Pseudohalioglobus lutimaris TaxID=1737061 RepID=A0A2N5X1Z7_9GAMM|nr:ACP phosphodiesterase [Pseudohalioglobus lutimaris]PLW68515.1 ACP phosphodiesterase [Pseudohalioglobus lutimaris]